MKKQTSNEGPFICHYDDMKGGLDWIIINKEWEFLQQEEVHHNGFEFGSFDNAHIAHYHAIATMLPKVREQHPDATSVSLAYCLQRTLEKHGPTSEA